MVNLVAIYEIICFIALLFPLVGLSISTIYLCRANTKHTFVILAQCIGSVTAVAALTLQVLYAYYFFDTYIEVFVLWILNSGAGMLSWLFAFKFYTSSRTMEALLFKKIEPMPKGR